MLNRVNTSGLRLKDYRNVRPSSFEKVEELHINDCLLQPDQVRCPAPEPQCYADRRPKILTMLCRYAENGVVESQFHKLTLLSIAGNHLSTFDVQAADLARLVFPSISTLIMEGNAFTSLMPLCHSLSSFFPSLHTLSLQRNQIVALESPQSTQKSSPVGYPKITSLDLSKNAISSSAFISSLSQAFPCLSLLRVTGNPFYDTDPNNPSQTAETAFMLTLVRIPSLTMLNYSVISDRDRAEGELYYLSLAEKAFENALQQDGARSRNSTQIQTAVSEWARYADLCAKYDRPNVLDNITTAGDERAEISPTLKTRRIFPPGTLGARLVTVSFELCADTPLHSGPDPRGSLAISLPRTFDVYRVKGLLLRRAPRDWGLRPLGFSFELVQEGVDGEEGERIPDSTRRIGDWIAEEVGECRIRVRIQETGRGGVEEMREEELRRLEELGGGEAE